MIVMVDGFLVSDPNILEMLWLKFEEKEINAGSAINQRCRVLLTESNLSRSAVMFPPAMSLLAGKYAVPLLPSAAQKQNVLELQMVMWDCANISIASITSPCKK